MSDVKPVTCANKAALKRLADNKTGSAKCYAVKDAEPGDTLLYPEAVVTALQAEIEALRKDGERYRWLRDRDNEALAYDFGDSDAAVDAAIDAAIAKEKQP